jgi:hypothetical protein
MTKARTTSPLTRN